MSKCRYDLSKDCSNTDCLTCVLDKVRAKIEEIEKNYGFDKATKYGNKNAEQQNLSYSTMHFYEIADIFDDIKEIIDKYNAESEG